MNSITSALTDSSNNRQKDLLLYFQTLEQQADGWKLSINELTNNRQNLDESAIFFYLKIVECYIKGRYELDCEENKFVVKQYVYNYFVSKKYDYQIFLLNKYASIVNELFQIEYPLGKWNGFFRDFLAQCNNKESTSLFLRILDQINTDIAEREHIQTIKEIEKSTLIKDLMRVSDVNLIVQFWFNIVSTYSECEPSIVNHCLIIMGKYVSWIDINLITGDSRMTNLLNLLYNDRIRISVLDCLFGILHKGMDPIAKASFTEQFCHLPCINELFAKDYNENEREFVIKLAKFFNKIGIELIESFKKSKSDHRTDASQLDVLFKAIENKFLILCKFLSNKDIEISMEVHQFAREYIQLIKYIIKQHNTSFNQSFTIEVMDNKMKEIVLTFDEIQEIVSMLVKILIENCKYPMDFEFSNDPLLDDENENEFENYRKSCNTLLDNLNQLNKEIFSNFVITTIIEPILTSNDIKKYKFNELEIALYFLKCIGDYLESKNNEKFNKLLSDLITNSIIDYPHIKITLMYFELICKYDKHFSTTLNQLMPQVLISFLSENGLKSRSIYLRSKVTRLFNRFVKSNIKNKASNKMFLGFSEEIITTVEPLIKLDYYLSFKGKLFNEFNSDEQHIKLNCENHLLLCESVSYLIMQNSLIEDKQKLALLRQIFLDNILEYTNESSNLLQNLLLNNSNESIIIDKIAHDKQIKILCEDIAHLINLTVHSLKGVSNPEMMKVNKLQNFYLEIFNNFAKFLSLNLNEECLNILQQSLCHFLHRLIVCLDENEILPLLPLLIQNVFLPRSYFTVNTIQEIVPLINQFVVKFKNSWIFHQNLLPFLNQFTLPFITYIFDLTNSGSLEEEDKFNLQKSYFSFISILTNVPEVIKNLREKNNQVFGQILVTLVQGLEMNDLTIQKQCMNIFKKMVENHEQLSSDLTNGNGNLMNNQINDDLFKCIYTSAIPTLIVLLFKIQDQNQIINEILNFLNSVLTVRGPIEFNEYLNQFFMQKFSINGDKVKQLSEAFLNKDLKQLKIHFKEFKQMHQQR